MMTSFSNAQYLQQMMQWGASHKPKAGNETATILGAILLGVVIGVAVTKMMDSLKGDSSISINERSTFQSFDNSNMDVDLSPQIQETNEGLSMIS